MPQVPLKPRELSVAAIDQVIDDAFAPLLLCSGPVFQAIARHTEADLDTQFVCHYVHNGWPNARKIHPAAREWYPLRAEIHDASPFLALLDDCVLVPETLRPQIREELHRGHPGMTAMTLRARETFVWPRMTSEIHGMVQLCSICQLHRNQPPKDAAAPAPNPTYPGEMLFADHFELDGRPYLAFYDLFSQFPFLLPVPNKGVDAFLQCFRAVCEISGVPR